MLNNLMYTVIGCSLILLVILGFILLTVLTAKFPYIMIGASFWLLVGLLVILLRILGAFDNEI